MNSNRRSIHPIDFTGHTVVSDGDAKIGTKTQLCFALCTCQLPIPHFPSPEHSMAKWGEKRTQRVKNMHHQCSLMIAGGHNSKKKRFGFRIYRFFGC